MRRQGRSTTILLPRLSVGSAAGLIIGAVAGSAVSDREQHDFGEEIRTSIEDDIPIGKVAIVAHIGERGPELVDSTLKSFDSRPKRIKLHNRPATIAKK